MLGINYILMICFQNLPSGSSRVGAIKLTYISKVVFWYWFTVMHELELLGIRVWLRGGFPSVSFSDDVQGHIMLKMVPPQCVGMSLIELGRI